MHDAATSGMIPASTADSAETALRALPGVLDAGVLARSTADGADMLVGYVTLRDGVAPPPPFAGLAAVVAVNRIARRADGAIDGAALERVPVWDDGLSAAWRDRLAASPGITGAAVTMQPADLSRPRLHLADLLPDHGAAEDADHGEDAGSHPAQPTHTPAHAPAQRPVIGQPLSERPALARGADPVPDPAFPWTFAAALDRAAATPGAHIAHVADDFSETIETYAELRTRARHALGGLRRLGLERGALVIIDASDSKTLLGAFWGAVLGGMVPVPMLAHTAAGTGVERLRLVWDFLGHPPVVAGAGAIAALAPRLAEHGLSALTLTDGRDLESAPAGEPAPATDPDEPALILLTSGSTGVPKGVVGSHRSLLSMAAAVTQQEGFGTADTTLNWMPLDHIGAIGFFSVLPTAIGASQVHVRTDPVLREPLRWLDLMDRHRASIGWAPNFAYALIAQAVAAAVDRTWDLSSIRFLVNAGEAVSNATMVEFFERLNRHGLRPGAIRPSFGMTETASAITTTPWFAGKATGPFMDLGPPVPTAAVRIVTEDGALLREGEIGQLELSGPQIFRGYHTRPDLTAAAFRDGWFRSGDLAYLAGGRLFITGRDKDVIIVNGANIYSHEIETVLAPVPGLDRTCTAAVGVRPPGAGTDRVAVFFHAPAHGTDGRAVAGLVRAIRRRLAAELGVAADLVIPIEPDRVPRTSIGKIRRPQLKTWFENGDFDEDVRRIERLTAGPATLPDWFLEKTWMPLPPAAPAIGPRGGVLAFTRGGPLAAALRDAAPGDGWTEVAADGGGPVGGGPVDALLAGAAARRILCLWTHGAGDGGVAPLLRLGQALQRLPDAARPDELTVVASGSQPVRPGDELAGERAALPGLLAALAAEVPGLACRLIDLPDGADPGPLLDEWAAAPSEPEIAFRDGQRLAARFVPVDACGAARPLPPGGVVLVTGGLGGVGRLVAPHLLTRHKARLLLVGRTAETNLDGERAAALATLRATGDVFYAAADVTDPAALRAAAEAARTRWGQPLAGIIHLAGEGSPRPLADETAERLSAAVAARAAALPALLDLVEGQAEAFLLVGGSVAGALGGAAMASYAAATAAQAAQAAAHIAAGDGRVRFVAFSAWRDTGMSRGITAPERVRAAGLHVIGPAAGLASLDAALGLPGRHLLIGMDGGHPRHAPRVPGPVQALHTPAATVTGPAALDGTAVLEDRFGTPFAAPITAADSLTRRDDAAEPPDGPTERRLARIWEAVLGTAVEGRHDDFFALGGNSLRAAQVAARVRDTFRIDLPVMAVLTGPTVARLAETLRTLEPKPGFADTLARRLEEIERMTPEQRAALRMGKPS